MIFHTTRYDHQASYVIPISPQAVNSEVHTTNSNVNTASPHASIPLAYATPLQLTTPPLNSLPSSINPTESCPQPIARAERSVGNRLDNHFQQQRNNNIGTGSHLSHNRTRSLEYSTLTRWRDHLFSCWHQLYPSCFCSIACPCILVGDLTATIQYMPFLFSFLLFITLYFIVIFLMVTQGGLGGALITWGFLAMFVCSIRKKIRLQNHFRHGNDSEDCANACCCMFCVIAQMSRHIFHYKDTVECDHYQLPHMCGKTNTQRRAHSNSSHGSRRLPRTTTTSTRSSRIPGGRNHRYSHARNHTTSTTTINPGTHSTNMPGIPPTTGSGVVTQSQLPSASATPVIAPIFAQITHVEHVEQTSMEGGSGGMISSTALMDSGVHYHGEGRSATSSRTRLDSGQVLGFDECHVSAVTHSIDGAAGGRVEGSRSWVV